MQLIFYHHFIPSITFHNFVIFLTSVEVQSWIISEEYCVEIIHMSNFKPGTVGKLDNSSSSIGPPAGIEPGAML